MPSTALFIGVFALTFFASIQFLEALSPRQLIGRSVDCVQQPRDLFLVVDGSASIGYSNFEKVRKFLSSLVSSVHIGKHKTHVGLLQFSNRRNIKIHFGLDKYYNTEAMVNEILDLPYQAGDTTMTNLALRKVAEEVFIKSAGDRPEVQDVLLVFTDGNARKKQLTIENAAVLKERGVRIVAIGAGDDFSGFKGELEKVASSPKDVKIVAFDDLANIVVDVLDEVCKVITFPPAITTSPPTTTQLPTTTQSPTTTAEPTTKKPRAPAPAAILPTPKPTLPPTPPPPKCGDNPKDVIFVIDGTVDYKDSTSRVAKRHFTKVKQFVKKTVSKLSDKFTVGVIQYSGYGKANVEVDFSHGTSIPKLRSLIRLIKHQRGTQRYTGNALVKANSKFYELDVLRGHQEYPKVIVLLTRGVPKDEYHTASMARMLHLRGIRLIAVGFGHHVGPMEPYLDAIATRYDDALFFKYRNLRKGSEQVARRLCESKADGPQPGYPLGGVSCHGKPHDIFFLVDGSASIKYFNFEKVRLFLMDFISLLRIESSNISTGLMQFSETPKTSVIWELSKTSEQFAINAIKNMRYQSGKMTMTGDALQRISETVFIGQGGDRPDVDDIVVIFTDGEAHDMALARIMATNLKKHGVTVIAIGAGTRGSEQGEKINEELEAMASRRDLVLTVDFANLDVFAEKAFPLICHQISLNSI